MTVSAATSGRGGDLAPVPRVAVAAPARGSGKSTLSIGLAAALRARGLAVAPFKKGPDFIDPMWLAAAAGRPCRNLDFFMAGEGRIRAAFARGGAGADLALVEMNHALHDGSDPAGADSGAALARLLGTPVILVVGALGLGRGVAPVVRGQVEFDPEVRFAGVVLNRVRGSRHERKLRDAVERWCGLAVLGALPDDPALGIAERHLGLTPLHEVPDLGPIVERLGEAVAAHLDLDRVLEAARSAGPLPWAAPEENEAGRGRRARRTPLMPVPGGFGETALPAPQRLDPPAGAGDQDEDWHGGGVALRGGLRDPGEARSRGVPQRQDPGSGTRHGGGSPPRERVRVGVAMDRAFTFYYPENLEALRAAGADLVPFSPLDDPRLPVVDALYVGGGFPELFMERLEANATMRDDVRRAVEGGLPAWAECGGLMYLAREIRWRDRRAAMAGVFPCAVELQERPAGHGYVLLESDGTLPWLPPGERLRGHEFHHSRLVDLGAGASFAFRVLRGSGAAPGRDGLVSGNCVAGYTHLHADGAPGWAAGFVGFARGRKR